MGKVQRRSNNKQPKAMDTQMTVEPAVSDAGSVVPSMSPTKQGSNPLIGRRESASMFLFNKDAVEETPDDVATREAERVENQKRADELAEEERERRVSEARDHEDELEVVRQINIEFSITAAEEEKQRRIREHEVAKVQEELLRERNSVAATIAVEKERQRRISEVEDVHVQSEEERQHSQKKAIEAMERERVRRLSSTEHQGRAPSSQWEAEGEEDTTASLHAFSEIPVVHASASKISVDDHTEWRCYIESSNPEQEKDNLRALRMSLEDDLKECKLAELVGDVRLLRFLRGHKQNVAVAATKFREMMTQRKKLNLDEIRQNIVDKNLTPLEFPGFAKIIPHVPILNAYDLTDVTNGHVFFFEMSGYADFKGLVEQVTDDEWTQFFLYEMEYRAIKLDQLSRQHEKLIQTVYVRNLKGFSIARFHPRLLTRIVNVIRIATACYPETTHETLFLNTPWIFHKIWNTLKPKLAETQLSKIHMSDDAYAHLVELVGGRDRLPKLLGGKNTTQMIPQTGFLGRDSYMLLCEDGATQAEIKAGGTLQLPFRISANDTICWEYEVKSHDIDFSVKLRTQGEGGAVEVDKVAKVRVAAGESIAGSYTATEDGTAVLSWDNVYSWTRGKTVAYKAKVVKATHDFSCLDISGNDCV